MNKTDPGKGKFTTITQCVSGGILMGLANLVPGISGGTMLVASGIFPRFVESLAEASTFKFRRESIIVLCLVVFSAVVSIFLLAGTIKGLVVEHRWIMFSLFIGLTLGGLPVVWNMAKPAETSLWLGALGGFLPMTALAWAQANSTSAGAASEGVFILFLAGLAGASAMILPGVSGGYLLLILGVYVPILGAIDSIKEAIAQGSWETAIAPGLNICLPVGLGVLLGVVVVSNLLKTMLARYEKPTLGVLLGFLAGAVFGLWPFKQGVKPVVGEVFKGQAMTPELIQELDPGKYPTQFFAPDLLQVCAAVGLAVGGFALTCLIARIGNKNPSEG
mgnify:CR=1 FL=1